VLPASMAVAVYMLPEWPSWSQVQSPVSLVLLYDILMLTVGFFAYHFVVES
jgi:hypothetical protein